MNPWIEELSHGSRRAVARLISLVEAGGETARRAVAELTPLTGKAHIVGITGAPGTGKSTLVNGLVHLYRQAGQTVGVIAVDPSSPFTGGAVLGDRVRMQAWANDPGVFIRSMASRGNLGGLARATADAIKVLDAFGRDIILVETVGAGQAEIAIAHNAHTIIVLLAPGLGDDVQAIKAGILEIADIFVVNKDDLAGADHVTRSLRMLLSLDSGKVQMLQDALSRLGLASGAPEQALENPAAPESLGEGSKWTPQILRTVASQGKGLEFLAVAIRSHRKYLQESHLWQRRQQERAAAEVLEILEMELFNKALAAMPLQERATLVNQVAGGQIDPHTAVQSWLGRMGL
ncbi:MAG: methylmalonyl Co-A mutase-associated GTPase MeaB [Chloroflexi bacterium]|nr:methylmalonyl Co-A mutase-associated GTPase MeaB [Chloroflexota bacterium]